MADFNLKTITPAATFTDGTSLFFGADGQSSGTPAPYTSAAIKTWIASFFTQRSNNLSDVANATTARTNIGAGAPINRAATGVASVYVTNFVSSITTATLTALRLYMLPIYWPGGAATTLAFTVTTGAAAGKVARCGLYNMKADGTPGTLVQEATSGGAVAVDVTGTQTLTISQTLPAGYYFAAYVSDGAPIVTGSTDNSTALGCLLTGIVVGVPVTFLFRALGALAAFGDESGNTFSMNASGTARPIIGIK